MTVSDIISGDIHTCVEDQDVHQVARNMGESLIRRLPVLSRESSLAGVISLNSIAQADDSDARVALSRSVTGAH